MLLNWGVEGVSYELDEEGKPHFTDQVLNDPDGLSVDCLLYTSENSRLCTYRKIRS